MPTKPTAALNETVEDLVGTNVTTPRTVIDVIRGTDEFTALEWLNVNKQLDLASHEVQGDAVLAALALAVVEDRRESALWRWDKFLPLNAGELFEHLGVDTDAVASGDAAPKSGD